MYFNLQVHRLVVINDDQQVEGVVSLSDILDFLVMRPAGSNKATF